jgi:exopolysaccharide biosynthesis WecB/TagA/CpsF family protein
MENLVAIAAKERVPIGLIGGRGEVAVDALKCLQETHPGLGGWAEEGPNINLKSQNSKLKYTNQKSKKNNSQQLNNIAIEQSGEDITPQYIQRIVEKIQETGVRLVFIGLGAPKQEHFIDALARQFQISLRQGSGHANFKFQIVMMAVGGAFDMISGRLPRAPAHVRLLGFEWLWRLARQPWRFTRQMSLLRFVALVITTPRNVH